MSYGDSSPRGSQGTAWFIPNYAGEKKKNNNNNNEMCQLPPASPTADTDAVGVMGFCGLVMRGWQMVMRWQRE